MEYYSYYGIEKYTFRIKISDFGVNFSYLQSFFFNDIFNHALVIDHSQVMLVHCIYLIGNRVYNIFKYCFILPKHNKRGGVAFHRSAFGHVNDMRCLEKVHALLFV